MLFYQNVLGAIWARPQAQQHQEFWQHCVCKQLANTKKVRWHQTGQEIVSFVYLYQTSSMCISTKTMSIQMIKAVTLQTKWQHKIA